MNNPDKLTQKVRISQMIVLATMSTLVYCGIFLYITRENAISPGLEGTPAMMLRGCLYGAALMTLAALKYVVPFSLKATKEERADEDTLFNKLQTFSIVCAALCESIGIYGFVLALLLHNLSDYVLLSAAAFWAFSINFPNADKWQNWIMSRRQRLD